MLKDGKEKGQKGGVFQKNKSQKQPEPDVSQKKFTIDF